MTQRLSVLYQWRKECIQFLKLFGRHMDPAAGVLENRQIPNMRFVGTVVIPCMVAYFGYVTAVAYIRW